jgi:hypothetical protein
MRRSRSFDRTRAWCPPSMGRLTTRSDASGRSTRQRSFVSWPLPTRYSVPPVGIAARSRSAAEAPPSSKTWQGLAPGRKIASPAAETPAPAMAPRASVSQVRGAITSKELRGEVRAPRERRGPPGRASAPSGTQVRNQSHTSSGRGGVGATAGILPQAPRRREAGKDRRRTGTAPTTPGSATVTHWVGGRGPAATRDRPPCANPIASTAARPQPHHEGRQRQEDVPTGVGPHERPLPRIELREHLLAQRAVNARSTELGRRCGRPQPLAGDPAPPEEPVPPETTRSPGRGHDAGRLIGIYERIRFADVPRRRGWSTLAGGRAEAGRGGGARSGDASPAPTVNAVSATPNLALAEVSPPRADSAEGLHVPPPAKASWAPLG